MYFILNVYFARVLTLNLLTTTIIAPPSNASKWQMGFNSAFKGLKTWLLYEKMHGKDSLKIR
jgi:hypothetical protein